MKKDFSNRVEMELGGAPAIFRSPPQCHMRVNNSRWSTEAPLSHKKKRDEKEEESAAKEETTRVSENEENKRKKKTKTLSSRMYTKKTTRMYIHIYKAHFN